MVCCFTNRGIRFKVIVYAVPLFVRGLNQVYVGGDQETKEPTKLMKLNNWVVIRLSAWRLKRWWAWINREKKVQMCLRVVWDDPSLFAQFDDWRLERSVLHNDKNPVFSKSNILIRSYQKSSNTCVIIVIYQSTWRLCRTKMIFDGAVAGRRSAKPPRRDGGTCFLWDGWPLENRSDRLACGATRSCLTPIMGPSSHWVVDFEASSQKSGSWMLFESSNWTSETCLKRLTCWWRLSGEGLTDCSSSYSDCRVQHVCEQL